MRLAARRRRVPRRQASRYLGHASEHRVHGNQPLVHASQHLVHAHQNPGHASEIGEHATVIDEHATMYLEKVRVPVGNAGPYARHARVLVENAREHAWRRSELRQQALLARAYLVPLVHPYTLTTAVPRASASRTTVLSPSAVEA